MFIFKLFATIILCFAGPQKGGELTLYTSRKTQLIEPLLKAYEQKTGVKIKHINGKAGVLIEKIKREGRKTKADVLITVDAGNLGHAADLGLLEPLTDKVFITQVPENYRGQNNQWVSLSLRARTLFYNPKKVDKKQLKSYQDLAHPKWKGQLCLRTSRKVYNQSLVASMIDRLGEKATKNAVMGWVNNLARPVFTSDTLLLKAIDRGDCGVGLANTYYLARLKKKGEAKNVEVFWPQANQGGVHVNVSGGGVVKASQNKAQAVAFLKWLLSPEAQQMFAGLNDEYPVNKNVERSSILKKWGDFTADRTSLRSIKNLQKRAVLLMDSAKYQ